jgi:hypothetical protein
MPVEEGKRTIEYAYNVAVLRVAIDEIQSLEPEQGTEAMGSRSYGLPRCQIDRKSKKSPHRQHNGKSDFVSE